MTEEARRNADGTLTVPGRAEGPGGMIGDGMITIGPDDPRYAAWDRYLSRQEEVDDLERQAGGTGSITAQLASRGYELNPCSGMISLDLPPGIIAPVEGGVTDFHVTVVYLGKDVDDKAFARACQRAQAAAAQVPGPLAGMVGGIGTFPPSAGSDGKVPAWAGVVLPGAELLRRALEDLSASEHKDWAPHVTVAYVDAGDPLPPPAPSMQVSFSHLSVHRGDDEVVRYPIGGDPGQAAGPEMVSGQAGHGG